MAKEPPQTVGDLRRKGIIKDDEITEAVDAYLSNRNLTAFHFASGHVLDVAAAVEAYRPAKVALAKKGTTGPYRLTMVRTAAILATPSKR